MARPSKYKTEYADLALNYCLLGATDQDLARFFEVDEKTINTWKQEHPEFLQSLKEGKYQADAKVAKSLYDRACGMEVKENVLDKRGEKTLTTTKYIPPDPTSAIFWLKNRRSMDWRDKQEIKHEGTISTIDVTPAERREYLKRLKNGNSR
jgi:hypothetical protein